MNLTCTTVICAEGIVFIFAVNRHSKKNRKKEKNGFVSNV